MAWSWLRRHPRLIDVGLVLATLAAAVGHAARAPVPAVGVAVALVQTLPLLLRRRQPLAVLAVTVAATAAVTAAWGFYNPLPAGIALFTVATLCDRRISLRAGGLALAVLAPPLWHEAGWLNLVGLVGRLLGFVVAWLIGDSLRTQRRYVRALEERAEQLEREREAEAARAVAEEQARIARELHDVVAHSVSVMVVQAAAADDVFDTRPDRAREALRAIEAAGRDALVELRRLLGSVRGDRAEYAPQPGLDRLDELVETVRAAGLEVELRIDGEPRPLPVAVELSAYRLVQEALTNVLKHAQATRAEIALRYGEDGLDVEVRDDGSGGGNGEGSGHGLLGMRERVSAFGGSLSAGPQPAGGFAVAARLPL
jgi:signal transduction histidine kinase